MNLDDFIDLDEYQRMNPDDFEDFDEQGERNYNEIPVSYDEQSLWDLHVPTTPPSDRLHAPTSARYMRDDEQGLWDLHVPTSSSAQLHAPTHYMQDDEQSLWDLHVPTSSSAGLHAPTTSARNMLDDPTRFGVVPSLLEVNTLEEGESSVSKRKHASDSLNFHREESD